MRLSSPLWAPSFALALALALATAATGRAAFVVAGPSDSASRLARSTPGGYSFSLDRTAVIASGPDFRSSPQGSYYDSLMKYDLGAAIPAGSTLVAATLAVNVELSLSTLGQADSLLLHISGSGTTPGAVGLGDFGAATGNVGRLQVPIGIGGGLTPSTGAGFPLQLDVTALIRSLLDGGSAAVAFQFDNLTPNTWSMISAGPTAPATARPTLTLTFQPSAGATPEPASLVLLGVGLAIVAARVAPGRRGAPRRAD